MAPPLPTPAPSPPLPLPVVDGHDAVHGVGQLLKRPEGQVEVVLGEGQHGGVEGLRTSGIGSSWGRGMVEADGRRECMRTAHEPQQGHHYHSAPCSTATAANGRRGGAAAAARPAPMSPAEHARMHARARTHTQVHFAWTLACAPPLCRLPSPRPFAPFPCAGTAPGSCPTPEGPSWLWHYMPLHGEANAICMK